MNSLTETTVRCHAKKVGLKLQKSRSRNQDWPGYGTYRLMQTNNNLVVFGGNHDTYGATLADCEQFIESRLLSGNNSRKSMT